MKPSAFIIPDALAVACPACGAAAGDPCRNIFDLTSVQEWPHLTRQADALAKRKKP